MDTAALETIVSLTALARHALEQSAFFALLILLLKIYSAVLIVDFVLIMFNRDLSGDFKKLRYGAVRPTISYAGAAKRWNGIVSKLDSGNPSHYKAAILEADTFADRLIGQMGYGGGNLSERLDAVPEGRLLCLSALREAHEVRNRIIREADFPVSLEDARETLERYRKLLDELQLL